MPHRCMECKNIVESGALQLENGCPVCGCKKFQYVRPKKKDKEKEKEKEAKPTVAEYVASVAEPVREPAPEVKPQEVVDVVKPAPEVKPKAEEKKPAGIESVLIHERGRYDINLPILLNRKELVMSKEEGIYIVDLPSALKAKKKKSAPKGQDTR